MKFFQNKDQTTFMNDFKKSGTKMVTKPPSKCTKIIQNKGLSKQSLKRPLRTKTIPNSFHGA